MSLINKIKKDLKPYFDSVIIELKKQFPDTKFSTRISVTGTSPRFGQWENYRLIFIVEIKKGWFKSITLLSGELILPNAYKYAMSILPESNTKPNSMVEVNINISKSDYRQLLVKLYDTFLMAAIKNTITKYDLKYKFEIKTL